MVLQLTGVKRLIYSPHPGDPSGGLAAHEHPGTHRQTQQKAIPLTGGKERLVFPPR